jgi:hypothetical protein
LWKRIKAVRHRFNDFVIVVNAVDLRRSGLDISHRLSWDRTVQDLAQASLAANGSLYEFTRVGHVVVRFDFDGAVIVPYRPGSQQTPGAQRRRFRLIRQSGCCAIPGPSRAISLGRYAVVSRAAIPAI